ncbi:MAG: hypothetical protein IKH75_06200 [Ruminococcus sp.]|nr:hypothetical protein [Ruminococcus sp.]
MENERMKGNKTEIRIKRVFGSQDFMDIYTQYTVNKYSDKIHELFETVPRQYGCSHVGKCKNISERD